MLLSSQWRLQSETREKNGISNENNKNMKYVGKMMAIVAKRYKNFDPRW